jgi:hypothetical protein
LDDTSLSADVLAWIESLLAFASASAVFNSASEPSSSVFDSAGILSPESAMNFSVW